MEKKKKRLIITVFAAVFFVGYIILAIKPLGSEYQMTPTWTVDVASPTVTPATDEDELLYFKFNRSMGYFTPEGKVTSFISYPQKASISKSFYTYYDTSNNYAPFFDSRGGKVGVIGAVGFPFIQGDNIFVFLPGGSSFSRCNSNGSIAWTYASVNPITAFDSSLNGVAVGFASGEIVEFDTEGTIMRRFSPGGSDYPAIHGIALSTDSSLIATICGQNKQRFVLARNEGVNAKIVFHEFIDTVSPYQMLVVFYNNNKNVVYNSGNILGFVDTRRGKSAHLKVTGHAIDAQECGNCIYVLTKVANKSPDGSEKTHISPTFDTNKLALNAQDSKFLTVETHDSTVSIPDYHYTVYIVERLATLIGQFSFDANVAFIKTNGDKLYIGKDSTISCLTLEKK